MSSSLAATLSDSAVITKRNLIKVKRVPDLIVFATLSPIMFVLLFRYVFGGAIQLPPGTSYGEFLLPGIFAQTIVLGSTTTGASLAEDMQKGLIDRFRLAMTALSDSVAARLLIGLLRWGPARPAARRRRSRRPRPRAR